MNTFAVKVKEILNERKITQKDLSIMSGVSPSSLSRYLNGKNPRLDVVINVSNALCVTKEYLLGKENKPLDTPFENAKTVLIRNKNLLTDEQKAKLVKILYT